MKLSKSALPLYYQLEKVLRRRILNGQIKPGDPIPTERELCEEFGVSRTTVRQALDKLENVDLIRREQGRGTFVTNRGYSNIQYKLYGHIEDLFTFGATTSLELKSKALLVPDSEIRADMNLEQGEKVYLFEGLRLLDAFNKACFRAYVPEPIGEKIRLEDIRTPVLINLVEKAALDTAKYARQITSAEAAQKDIAAMLNIDPGSPLLVTKRIYYTAEDKVLEMAVTLHPGSVFKSVAKLDKLDLSKA